MIGSGRSGWITLVQSDDSPAVDFMWIKPHLSPVGMSTYSVSTHVAASATRDASVKKAEPGNGKKGPDAKASSGPGPSGTSLLSQSIFSEVEMVFSPI